MDPHQIEGSDPDPPQSYMLDPNPDPHRIRIKVISWIRINLQMTSQNVLNMSQFEPIFKVLSLYLEAGIRIRIKMTSRIRIRIKVTSRIRIRNTGIKGRYIFKYYFIHLLPFRFP
jgi:hypothetical protein